MGYSSERRTPMTPGQFKTTSISGRVAFIVILVLLGFVFPPSFGLAAWLAYSLRRELRPAAPDHGLKSIKSVHQGDRDWQAAFRAACESPAEVAFLDAMIAAFHLKPEAGVLRGSGLTLALQVPVGHYRLDFLVDDRLIVEIDGAAYHSSPEAVRRDRRRDDYSHIEGYRVLRIAAKYPLYSPREAISRVIEARTEMIRENTAKATQINQSLHPVAVLHSMSSAVSTMTTYVSQGVKRQKEEERVAAEEQKARDLAALEYEQEHSEELRQKFDDLSKEF